MKQFSLSSLLIVLTLVAVCYSAWNQFRQSKEIANLRSTLNASRNEQRLTCRVIDLLLYLADNDDDHTRQLLDPLIPPTPDLSLDPDVHALVRSITSNILIADVDGKPGGLEILSLNTALTTIPGNSTSVNVLFDGDSIVDIVSRSTGARTEAHDVLLKDADGDGSIDLVISCNPGFMSSGSAKKLIYNASEKGFVLQ